MEMENSVQDQDQVLQVGMDGDVKGDPAGGGKGRGRGDDGAKAWSFRKDGNEEQQVEFRRPGSRANVDNTASIADPLAQLKTDVKKAKINAIWEQLNAKDAVFSSRTGRGAAAPSSAGPPSTKSAGVTPGWMKNLGMVPKKPVLELERLSAENGAKEATDGSEGIISTDGESDHKAKADAIKKEEARKVASAALAAAKAGAKAITDGKVEINEVRDFAGEEVRVTKYVDPNSKAAVAARRKAEVSSSGLDALLEQIGKKQKLNILDKSRKDWGEFKEDTGIENELELHIKSGDKYTDKVAFLQRSDVREYEKERDARLAVLSKRRSESAPVD